MLVITDQIKIPESEIEISAIRAQGPGGQNVNKVASAIHLRFDIANSSLSIDVRQRLLNLSDYRITRGGILVIKAQRYRTREQNLMDARERLKKLVAAALEVKKQRKRTRPPVAAKHRRLDQKTRRSVIKKLRTKISSDD
jgi:ribosome-associated protein